MELDILAWGIIFVAVCALCNFETIVDIVVVGAAWIAIGWAVIQLLKGCI